MEVKMSRLNTAIRFCLGRHLCLLRSIDVSVRWYEKPRASIDMPGDDCTQMPPRMCVFARRVCPLGTQTLQRELFLLPSLIIANSVPSEEKKHDASSSNDSGDGSANLGFPKSVDVSQAAAESSDGNASKLVVSNKVRSNVRSRACWSYRDRLPKLRLAQVSRSICRCLCARRSDTRMARSSCSNSLGETDICNKGLSCADGVWHDTHHRQGGPKNAIF